MVSNCTIKLLPTYKKNKERKGEKKKDADDYSFVQRERQRKRWINKCHYPVTSQGEQNLQIQKY